MKNSERGLKSRCSPDSDELLRLKQQAKECVKNILFVCTGNICRSPVAEYLLRQELEKQKNDSIRVFSAGTMDMGQQPAPREMVELAESFRVDMKNHRSKTLTKSMVEEADLIFAMEIFHKNKICELFPDYKHKVFMLSLFDSRFNGVNINDPLGRDYYNYRYCFDRIYSLVQKLILVISRKVS
ncbi:MAG: low molecular weight protein arginine phosphatase [Nitrospinales bacterium]